MSLSTIKEELILLNETIYFDSNQFLREKSSDPSKIKQVIDKAEVLLERRTNLIAEDEEHFLYGTLGNLYRILGEPKIAVTYLMLNLKYAIEEGNHTREIISLIRLGEALKNDNKHADALEKFTRALALCNETGNQSYTDFALQHKGKCLLELNNVEDALVCFREALNIRKEKGIRSLIDSTQVALEFALRLSHRKDINSK